MDKYNFKIGSNNFTLTPLTKRKTCPLCNGKGWVEYPDTREKDGCELCGGIPNCSFKSVVIGCLDDSSLNYLFLKKYFSKDDFEKFELAQTLIREMDKNFELTNTNAYENTPSWLKEERANG